MILVMQHIEEMTVLHIRTFDRHSSYVKVKVPQIRVIDPPNRATAHSW